MSAKSPPETPPVELGEIEAAANAESERAQTVPESARLAALEERLASIEPLLEQLQANVGLGTKLTEYVGDLRSEQVFFNIARYAVGAISLGTIISLLGLLAVSIFHTKSPLLTAPPLAIATFVIGLVSSTAILLSSFVKGVFRSTAERHADGFLPPALENGIELMNKVIGKSS